MVALSRDRNVLNNNDHGPDYYFSLKSKLSIVGDQGSG